MRLSILDQLRAENCLHYVSDMDAVTWTRSWIAPGLDELVESFPIPATVANVSAGLFDRGGSVAGFGENVDAVRQLRTAGDYAVRVRLLVRRFIHGEVPVAPRVRQQPAEYIGVVHRQFGTAAPGLASSRH